MLGDSINIKNFDWNSAVLKKKLLKRLKITIFWLNFWKNEVPTSHAQNKHFFGEITKADPKSFQNLFILTKYYMF